MKQLIFISIILLLTSCADTVDVQQCLPADSYGFWFGLWHGIIAPFAFIGFLFNDSISGFAVNNTGGWYVFGFLLGIGAFTGTVSTTTASSARKN